MKVHYARGLCEQCWRKIRGEEMRKYSALKDIYAIRLGRPIEEFKFRADGRLAWICKHQYWHTVFFPRDKDGVHSCDGCCQDLKKKVEN